MGTGFGGTFVISWAQTWIDGQRNAEEAALEPGAAWAWQGEALRVDGPASILRLERPDREFAPRDRVARAAHRVTGLRGQVAPADPDLEEAAQGSFIVSDGLRHFTIARAQTRDGRELLVFQDEMPPRDRRLWVVDCTYAEVLPPRPAPLPGLAQGTRIATPDGPRPVEDLQVGDRVQTLGQGPQPVLWTCHTEIPSIRLEVYPELRPIRIPRAGDGPWRPDADLLVSASQAVMMRGGGALFNAHEVLIRAEDALSLPGLSPAQDRSAATLVSLLLPRPAILRANGLPVQSLCLGDETLQGLSSRERQALTEAAPSRAGALWHPARRLLTRSEAAIFLHRAA